MISQSSLINQYSVKNLEAPPAPREIKDFQMVKQNEITPREMIGDLIPCFRETDFYPHIMGKEASHVASIVNTTLRRIMKDAVRVYADSKTPDEIVWGERRAEKDNMEATLIFVRDIIPIAQCTHEKAMPTDNNPGEWLCPNCNKKLKLLFQEI